MSKNFYLTTPLYYVNDVPHIGHAYTTILADVLNRYHQLMGYDTYLMTGTDEHGQKVQQAASKRGVSEKEHVDEYNIRFKKLWETLGIQYNKFIRTTDEDHISYVQECLGKLWEKGEIYTDTYAGWYSVSEERYFGEDELVDGKDPIGNKPVEWIEEKNYFFKMGKYQDKLIQYINDNPNFIQPEFRKNEILGFLRQPLNDLCISRPKRRLSWGIPLPFDTEYVTYVWFDALLNYVSGVRHNKFQDGSNMWPASYHLIGKDILTTHSVYWTTMLMALELPLPQHILAHGWWLNGGAKMSKSSGTAINPFPYMEKFGVDTFRYYVMRDMVLGQDASFTDESFIKRINSDLANDLGNGLNRVTNLINKNFDGKVPDIECWSENEEELKVYAQSVISNVFDFIPKLKLSQAIEEIIGLVRKVNKYLEVTAPWKLVKDLNNEDNRHLLNTSLYVSAETMRIVLALLSPVIPEKSKSGLATLGIDSVTLEDVSWGKLKPGTILNNVQALFPRIEVEKKAKPQQQQKQDVHPLSKFDFRVVEIMEAEPHPDAEKLLKLSINNGEETRTVCAGISAFYEPEALVGKKAVLFNNLKPAKIRGVESKGMLLAASNGDALSLVNPGEIPVGKSLQIGEHPVVPKAKMKINDFDKIKLEVQSGKVVCEGLSLTFEGTSIAADAPDGSEVR